MTLDSDGPRTARLAGVGVLRVMPETKGVPLEDIQKRLGIA